MSTPEKFIQRLCSFTAKDYYGFTPGHQSLTLAQIEEIAQVLQQGENTKIVREYETQFSLIVGNGFVQSFLAARMAFYSLMTVLNIKQGDEVILPAFTSAVMPNAVWRRGATPVYADIDPQTYGSSAETIEKQINKNTKMIVAQHSFGIPCQIEEIVKLGAKYGIFVLEDASIALGSSRDGVKLGDWADASIFSTDNTKPVNTMIGGIIYTKNAALFEKLSEFASKLPQLNIDHQVRVFEQMLFERKNHGPEKLGKAFLPKMLQGLKGKDKKENSVFLENDYVQSNIAEADYPYPGPMPVFLAQLGLYEVIRWPNESRDRQEILKKYLGLLQKYSLDDAVPEAYRDQRNTIVPLRFAFSLPQASQLKKAMVSFMDIEQIWFQSPIICCPKGPEYWGYKRGSCPVAERISQNIINWPTVVPEEWRDKLIEHLRVSCKALKKD